MLIRYYVYELTLAGALAGCARAVDDRGAAPLADNAELHIDQKITVVGEVDEVRGEQTFTLKNVNLMVDEHLLVIAKRPARQITMGGALVHRGEWLQIHGTVRRLSVPGMERAYGFDLDPDFEVRYDGRPVVVTDWISQPEVRSSAATPDLSIALATPWPVADSTPRNRQGPSVVVSKSPRAETGAQ